MTFSNRVLTSIHLSNQAYLKRILHSTAQLAIVDKVFFNFIYIFPRMMDHCSRVIDIDLEISNSENHVSMIL